MRTRKTSDSREDADHGRAARIRAEHSAKPEVRRPGKDDFYDLLDGVRHKFVAGSPLTDYEAHIYVDMILLHQRLYG